MLAEVRRTHILRTLDKTGQVATDDLANQLDVSTETIRRDLHVLEERGELQRVYGGAVLGAGTVWGEAPYHERRSVAADEKAAIAQAVVDEIPQDSTVFLDLGTTVDAIVEALPLDYTGTLVTTSLRAATQLARLDHCEIVLAGGRLRRDELSLSGSAAAGFLRDIYPDVAIISTGAVDAARGVTDYDAEERHIKRLILSHSQISFVVADSTKFGKTATYGVCPVDRPTRIVTTTRLGHQTGHAIEQAGGRLLLAPCAPNARE